MSSPTITNRQLLELVKVYWQWRGLWILTTLAFGSLGLVYALFLKSDTWVASQGLIVRDEANGAVMRLGRFQSQTEMKTAQETIQEMARNTQVLHDALLRVGPEKNWLAELRGTKEPQWPSTKTIEELAQHGIEVRAPRGAEFGTTEVIYLDIKQNSRERALELNKAVCEGLEAQLQTVRKSRADGVISELLTAKMAGERALAEATIRLQRIEAEAGPDLPDLRGMTDTSGGGNTNKQVLDSIKSEIRLLELKLGQLEIDLQLARESLDNPDALLLTPGRLVTDQPGLKKLREGLADATIKTSELKGRYTELNPLVKAAVETESRIRQQLRNELRVAVESMARDLEVNSQQLVRLRLQQDQSEERLNKIAGIRADYSNVVSDVRARNTHLQELQRELAEAEAARESAGNSSLLTRLEAPILGERPLGPGRTTIVAGSGVGGLFFGLGLVFLLTPLDGGINYGRRRQDLLGRGRRQEDRSDTVAGERRQLQQPPAGQSNSNASSPHQGPLADASSEETTEIQVAETLAPVKMRASDVLVARRQAGRATSKAPSSPTSPSPASQPAASTKPSSLGGVKPGGPSDSARIRLSELSNAAPQPAARKTEAEPQPTPANSHRGASTAAGTATIVASTASNTNGLTSKENGMSDRAASPELKLRPTPWTSSPELKAAANDPRFANNALLGSRTTDNTKRTGGTVIEVVENRQTKSTSSKTSSSKKASPAAPLAPPLLGDGLGAAAAGTPLMDSTK